MSNNKKKTTKKPQTERLHYLFAMETSPPTRTRARAADMIALCAILTSTRAATARTVHSFLAFCKRIQESRLVSEHQAASQLNLILSAAGMYYFPNKNSQHKHSEKVRNMS